MKSDELFRLVAVLAAVALVAAPYWQTIKAAAARGLEAGKEKAGLLSRIAAAALLIAAAWGKLPLPKIPTGVHAPVAVETPTVEMQALVAPVAEAMRGASHVDRALWAELWQKCAIVVAAPDAPDLVVFTDTRSLRLFTTLAVDLAWRRIGGHVPGTQEDLRRAVEAAYGTAIGSDVVPVTPELRQRYAAFARAIAWAGVGKG